MDPQQNICTTCLSTDRILTPLLEISSVLQVLKLNELIRPGFICWECVTIINKFFDFKTRCEKAEKSLNSLKKQLQPLSTLGRTTKSFCDYHFSYNDPLNDCDLDNKTEINEIKNEPEDFKYENNIYVENIKTIHPPGIEKVDINVAEDTDNNVIRLSKRRARKHYVSDINKEEIDAEEDISDIDNKTTLEHIKTKPTSNVPDITKEEIDGADIVSTEQETDTETNIERQEQGKNNKNRKLDNKSHNEVMEKFDFVVFTEEDVVKLREEKRNHPNYKKIPFKCDSCVLGFTKETFYVQHVKKKHDESIGKTLCPVCDTRFSTLRAMERHKSKHYTCYRCRLCKYDTLELWSALNHCRMKHPRDTANNIHCAQCRQVCRTPEDLAEHVKKEHSVCCKECGVKFKGKHSLRSHRRRIHAVIRSFQCDLCKKTFTKKSRLESHMVTHNSTIAKKLAFCAICNVQYKNLYIYRSHLRNSTNHSERLYPCPECNKKFSSKFYRTQHYNFYHLQKSSYKCDICNKLFISDWRLRNHKQTKHGMNRPRDHPCNVCGKKFFTVSTLRAHQLTHSEQRTYMCEDCGDTFRQRPALYNHARLVHKSVKRK